MKKLCSMFLIGLCAVNLANAESQQISTSDNDKPSNLSAEAISASNIAQIKQLLEQYSVPGAAVAVVGPNGVIWSEGFGVTEHNGKQAVNTKTLFSIQSQSKMFTALGVMCAAQDGLVDLNTPINRYLPELKVYSVFEKNPVNKITLKSLLSHTAGFAHEAPVGNNYGSQADFQEHMDSILAGVWLQFPVNKGYNYSNVGIDLAGYILQKQSKTPYADFMDKNVLLPLEMNSSTFDIKKYLANFNRAIGYIEGIESAPISYSTVPSGGLYSNVEDLAHYIKFQLQNGRYNGKQVVQSSILKVMKTIPFPQDGQIRGNALGLWKDQRLGTTYYSHLGRGFGFASNLEWYPRYQIGIVVLTNKYDMNNVDIKIAHMIIDPIIQAQSNQEKLKIEKAMLGEYTSNMFNINVVKDKTTGEIALQGMITSGPMGNNFIKEYYPLTCIGDNEFYSAKDHEKYRFIQRGITNNITLERVGDGFMWYMNIPKSQPFGANKKSWLQYLGDYELKGYGAPMKFSVQMTNGYLYLNNNRLQQKSDGVFIMPNGQVVVFKDNQMQWADLTLTKKKS